jgi:hypothetical protein
MGEQEPSIKSAGRSLRHGALLAVTVALLAGHGVFLQLLAAHTSLSLAVVSALGGTGRDKAPGIARRHLRSITELPAPQTMMNARRRCLQISAGH